MAVGNQRRANPRSAPGSDGEQPPTDEALTNNPGGAQVVWLDPRVIDWPVVRITSDYDEDRSSALLRSMEELGQQDAVGVFQLEDGSYEGAAGMNRCRVAIESGASQILCVVRQGSHRDVVKANIATSVNQSRANPLSEAEGIANAHYEEGFSIEELVSASGKSEGWIADRLLIHDASPAVKQCLGDGHISIGHAVLLAGVDDHTAQEEELQSILTHRWTVKELEDHLRGPDEGAEPTERRQRGPRAQDPKALSCSYCEKEHEPAAVHRLTVCQGCMENVGPGKSSYRLEDGELVALMVPLELLREMEDVLAGTQAGAPLAERVSKLVEVSTDAGT